MTLVRIFVWSMRRLGANANLSRREFRQNITRPSLTSRVNARISSIIQTGTKTNPAPGAVRGCEVKRMEDQVTKVKVDFDFAAVNAALDELSAKVDRMQSIMEELSVKADTISEKLRS